MINENEPNNYNKTTFEYLFMIEDVNLGFSELQIHDPAGGFKTAEEFKEDHQVSSTKEMRIAYLVEGVEFKKLYDLRKKRQQEAWFNTVYWIGAATLIFILVGGYSVFNKTSRVTKGIIQKYETLKTMQYQSSGSKRKPVLSYKAACKELNELHRTFNKVIKATTINISDEKDE